MDSAPEAGDKCFQLCSACADANMLGVTLFSYIADKDVVAPGRVAAREVTNGDVVIALCVKESSEAYGRIRIAGFIFIECVYADGNVLRAADIVQQSVLPLSDIVAAGGVTRESVRTDG